MREMEFREEQVTFPNGVWERGDGAMELRRQLRSQVQLGNEGRRLPNGGEAFVLAKGWGDGKA